MNVAQSILMGCVAIGLVIGWVVGLVRVVVYRAEGAELFLCPLLGLCGGMGLFLASFILLWAWPLALIMGLCAIPFGAISLWRRMIIGAVRGKQ